MAVFKPNFNCIISGPSQSGKTTLIKKIIENAPVMFDPPLDEIIWCYDQYQPMYSTLPENVTLHEGIPNIQDLKSKKRTLLVLDDLMVECTGSSDFSKLFSVYTHHCNCSVFLIAQNLFHKGKEMRTMSLNTHYFIIFRNPRDQTSFHYLARQIYPPPKSKHLIQAYQDATTSKAHSYLFLDLTQNTDDRLRVRTGILPTDQQIVYII